MNEKEIFTRCENGGNVCNCNNEGECKYASQEYQDGMRQAERDLDFEDDDFIPCSECDGHDACWDFGCAIEQGLGHLVKTDNNLI